MITSKYIVIEGAEAVGKTTQAQMLIEKLAEHKIEAVYIQEPGSTPFAVALRELIKNGPERSAKTNVLAFNAARAETMLQIRQAMADGRWVIADRSLLSTIVYQGYGEGQDIEEIRQICEFAAEVRPDLMMVIDADPAVLMARWEERGETDYFEEMASDFHDRVRQGYLQEAHQQNLPVIDGNGEQAQVSELIWDEVKSLLEEKPKSKKTKTRNPYIDKTNAVATITDSGREYLSEVLTNVDDDVYVFNENISPVTVAAAMARLSRRGDDMRVTLLDEFSRKKGKDEALLKRVITAYGDDSVQQLTGVHAVVENASNLLTKKLEWGRLAAYLEQSTRYIYFDQRDANGNYRYYTPPEFDDKTRHIYRETLVNIFDLYSEMVHELTDYVRAIDTTPESERDIAWKGATRAQACDAARDVLPIATTSTVGIYASGQAYETMIMNLLSDELAESRTTGKKLLAEGRKVIATFLERADKPERGGATVAYKATQRENIAKLADKYLPQISMDHESVNLVDVSMRNEMELVPYILYQESALSMSEIRKEVETWKYEQKLEVFQAYIGERLNRRHKPGRAFEHLEYTFDIICDYGIFRDLQRHRMVEGLDWQELSPRYGYDVPQLIQDAELVEKFQKCFDLSYQLYSRLQALGLYNEAQYAVLMGHKMRWKIGYNARQAFHFHELRTSPQGHPAYRRLVKAMHDKIAEVHPLIAGAMKFVNQDEDPGLTRLAAERYTQYKLKQLDAQE